MTNTWSGKTWWEDMASIITRIRARLAKGDAQAKLAKLRDHQESGSQ